MNAQEFSRKVLESRRPKKYLVKRINKLLEEHSGVSSSDGFYRITIVTHVFYHGIYDDLEQLMLSKGFTDVEVLISNYFNRDPDGYKIKFKLPPQGE